MEPQSFQCPHCDHQLVINEPSQGPVSGPCPVCANFITADSSASESPIAPARDTTPTEPDLLAERESPVLLQSRRYRRGKFAGSRRSTQSWFKGGLKEDPIENEGLPLVINRSRSGFIEREGLVNRLTRLSEESPS